MKSSCTLCRNRPHQGECYVRLGTREEAPVCRPCWEQAFLAPRQTLVSLLESGILSRNDLDAPSLPT